MPTEQWSAMADEGTVLSTQLNGLANAAYCAAGPTYDNGADLNRYGVLELTVTFGSAPTDDGAVDFYAIPAPDGTTYADGGSTRDPAAERYVGSCTVQNTTSAQRLVSNEFVLPPCKVQFVARNGTGQAFPASGSVVKLYTYNRTIN
jgi:hypothetical protein